MTTPGDLVATPLWADFDDQTVLINRMCNLDMFEDHFIKALDQLNRDACSRRGCCTSACAPGSWVRRCASPPSSASWTMRWAWTAGLDPAPGRGRAAWRASAQAVEATTADPWPTTHHPTGARADDRIPQVSKTFPGRRPCRARPAADRPADPEGEVFGLLGFSGAGKSTCCG
jgi:hypothetical protein